MNGHPKNPCEHVTRTHTPAAPATEPNPCEENGCIDIENCDEICEHMKIFSPAYVRTARKDAVEKVLAALDVELQEIKSRIESSAMGAPLSERERGKIIGILDARVKIESLRGGGAP